MQRTTRSQSAVRTIVDVCRRALTRFANISPRFSPGSVRSPRTSASPWPTGSRAPRNVPHFFPLTEQTSLSLFLSSSLPVSPEVLNTNYTISRLSIRSSENVDRTSTLDGSGIEGQSRVRDTRTFTRQKINFGNDLVVTVVPALGGKKKNSHFHSK